MADVALRTALTENEIQLVSGLTSGHTVSIEP
jgi:hypothetical protein